MGRIEKTVFVSYRRTDEPWGLAIFQDLTQHGYDVFIDYDGISSGNFETVILENIRARAHFLVLLTPTALERCGDPKDWLRREIEAALESQRNIVPVMLAGFDFGKPAIASQLTGKLATLRKYNGLEIPGASFFSSQMERLRNKYFNLPVDAVLHPASDSAQQVAKEQKDKATMNERGVDLDAATKAVSRDGETQVGPPDKLPFALVKLGQEIISKHSIPFSAYLLVVVGLLSVFAFAHGRRVPSTPGVSIGLFMGFLAAVAFALLLYSALKESKTAATIIMFIAAAFLTLLIILFGVPSISSVFLALAPQDRGNFNDDYFASCTAVFFIIIIYLARLFILNFGRLVASQ
jgi:hypothetical protein